MPFASFVLLGYKSLMSVVVKFNMWASTFNFSIVATTGALSVLVMLIVTFVLSDYLFVSNKTKKVISLLGVAAFLSMLVFV